MNREEICGLICEKNVYRFLWAQMVQPSAVNGASGREYSHAQNSLAHVHRQMHASGPRCDAIKDPFVCLEAFGGEKLDIPLCELEQGSKRCSNVAVLSITVDGVQS